jgi:Aldehyde oxidase and xanthine dehydrogenase, a/b hammerhead domain
MSLVNRYIGAPIKRVEDLRFLWGRGEYVADLARAEMLHAAILRSPVAHARIRAIDPTPALAIGGVHALITAAEIGAVPRIPLRLQASPATEPFCQPVIARDRVRYVGADRGRAGRERGARRGWCRGDHARSRGAADRCRPVYFATPGNAPLRRRRHQPGNAIHCDTRRRRRGFPRRRIYQARASHRAAAHRTTPRAAWIARQMGSRRGAPDGHGRCRSSTAAPSHK